LVASFPGALQAESSLLTDVNGDGTISVTTFGDSITYGVGDGSAPGDFVEDISDSGEPRGYPLRLNSLLKVPVQNSGVPGEEFVVEGVYRLPSVATRATVDTMVVLEGSNDAVMQIPQSAFARAVQTAINITRAAGKQIVFATIPPATGSHASLAPITEAYSARIRELAAINDIPLVDVEALWRSTCPELESCDLYNLPEGLHPNTKGYDALSQMVAAKLFGIDLLSAGGAAQLEGKLGLPAGSVIVQPPAASTKSF
jgi:lysophospholipase L1-like esterase